jgi:HD-like signal output (HDOD) protein
VGRQVDSLQQAVVMLGDSGLRRLLLTAAMRPIIDARAGLISAEGASRLWRKNQRAALAADFLAQRLATPRFPAFLSGLLSQAGLLVLARALAASGQPGFGAVTDPFLVELDTLARQVSVIICERWEMPELVTDTARVLAGGDPAGAPERLVQVVLAGDLLARFTLLEEAGHVDAVGLHACFGLEGVSESLAGACLGMVREGDAEAA